MTKARSWFAWRMGAVFAGLSLLSVVYTYSRPASLHLVIEMASSSPSIAQVFYDTGQGFRESESSSVRVESRPLTEFQQLLFILPRTKIFHLRFDPLAGSGRVVIRRIAVMNNRAVVKTIALTQVRPVNQIAAVNQHPQNIEIVTAEGAKDPIITLELAEPLRLEWIFVGQNVFRLGIINLTLLCLYFAVLFGREKVLAGWHWALSADGALERRLAHWANELGSEDYLAVDALALRVYAALACFFCLACVLDLNGSSAGMYSENYGHGPKVKSLLGMPRASRSDEWAYETPAILNQYFRADRFAAGESIMGNYNAALIGNLPVKDVSTLFRPQFWSFFVLPLSYAFSVYWQAKALILVGGVFTFLLWMTRSSGWALTGALWYFFSPFVQWTYSWPSGLPEMVGSICLGIVCVCYLTVGRSGRWLGAAAVGSIFCGVNFAMCGYVPHLIPLFWVAVAMVCAWCIAARQNIARPEKRTLRIIAVAITALVLAGTGGLVYSELKVAIAAVAATSYPGHRVIPGGSLPPWIFASHFFQWTESESGFPATLGNICEGSGFLWLAPVTLLCLPKLQLSGFQKASLAALWFCLALLFCWCAFRTPQIIGHLSQLELSAGPRCLAAMGLVNIGIVTLTAAAFQRKPNDAGGWFRVFHFVSASLVFLVVLRFANAHLNHYFPRLEIALGAAFLGLLAMLILNGGRRTLAALLVVPQALVFGTVNPVDQGLPVFTNSDFRRFVQSHTEVLKGKWLVYADSPVRSGFIAAAGCEIYTGLRYVPDVDHFQLFSARGLNLNMVNRLGYLDGHAIDSGEATRFVELVPGVLSWRVAANDPLLPKLGIRYVAFDTKPDEKLTQGLKLLSDVAVDGLWIYRIQGA